MRLYRFIFTECIRNHSSILVQQRVTKLLFAGFGSSSSSLFLPFSTQGSSSVFAVNSRSSIDLRKSNLSVVEVHSRAISSSVSGSSSQRGVNWDCYVFNMGFFLDMKPHSLSRRVEGEPLFVSQVIQGAMEILDFYIYNSMTKQKEVFKPKEPGVVKMYVCGITSYDFSHVGHGRANVSFDILYRYLQYLGYKVTYVRNFTDVDDKIIQRANTEGVDPLVLSNRFCQEFLDDMNDLNCLPPTHQPRVSDHMDQIIDMINKIITNGCAYTVDGDVYYSVDKFSNYGCLSKRKMEGNRAGERVAVDSRKQNPADFALWKAAKPGEPSWKSPWGHGRPGWHIECSAMSAHYLTPSFDIHGGGIDLIFPHHENEIAQSWAACSEANITYWAHNGHMTCNDVKMSKSLGNHESIRKVTGLYHPLALRYFFLCTHYRSSINYSTSQLEISSDAIFYIYQTLHDCRESLSSFVGRKSANAPKAKVTSEAQEYIDKLLSDFKEKMSDDLHIPGFLNSTFQEALRFLNTSLNKLKKSKQNVASLLLSIASLEDVVKEVLDTIGLLPSSYSEVLDDLRNKALKMAGLTENDIKSAIEERAQARNDKDYKRSDQIRSDLVNKGIDLMDVGKETVWRPRFGH